MGSSLNPSFHVIGLRPRITFIGLWPIMCLWPVTSTNVTNSLYFQFIIINNLAYGQIWPAASTNVTNSLYFQLEVFNINSINYAKLNE
jgi:hypothetical protein